MPETREDRWALVLSRIEETQIRDKREGWESPTLFVKFKCWRNLGIPLEDSKSIIDWLIGRATCQLPEKAKVVDNSTIDYDNGEQGKIRFEYKHSIGDRIRITEIDSGINSGITKTDNSEESRQT